MAILKKLTSVIRNPSKIVVKLGKSSIGELVPDKVFLRAMYRASTGKKLNIDAPKGFNEKLQWLKLHDRNPKYINLVDKVEAKKYVQEVIGEEHIIPTIGVWNTFDEIDFSALPEQFVLKCTHDSGTVEIVKNKCTFDVKSARIRFQNALARNHYYGGREWPYKYVKPRIIAEKYMEDYTSSETGGELVDYKFYCFQGKPRFLYIATANFCNGVKNDKMMYKWLDWSDTPFKRPDHAALQYDVKPPEKIEEMIQLAEKLSCGFPFVRTDFYYINDTVYFSELTFYPGSGVGLFEPESWEDEIGSWITVV